MKEAYIKIVTTSRKGFSDPSRDKIVLLGFWADKLEIFEGEEREILQEFSNRFIEYDPDRIIGFKINYEEWPFIIERAKKVGLRMNLGRDGSEVKITGKYYRGIILRQAKIKGRENIDMFPIAWRDFPQLPTKELDELAEANGVDCPKLPLDYEICEKVESGDYDFLRNYIKEYLSVVKNLAEKIIPFQEELAKLVGLELEEQISRTVGELVDVLVSREMKKRGIKEMKVGKVKEYGGGLVWLKEPGVYENVAYLDFQSMYPSIIKEWNISPETVDVDGGEVIEVEGVRHTILRDKKGVIPQIVEDFLSKRLELKKKLKELKGSERIRVDAQQHALKVLINAMYGYMGWSGASYYNRGAAELIASLARHYIKKVRDELKEMGCDVIYIDTDGIQFTGCNVEKVADKINEKYPLTIEIEYVAEKAAFWTKKKYVHLVDGKIVGKGMEFVRKDYPKIVKEAQRKYIELMLRGDREEAKKIKEEYRNRISSGEFELDEIYTVEQLTKKPEEYEKATKASVAAKIIKDMLGIELHRGTNLRIVIVKGTDGPTNRARPIQLVSKEDVDINYYLQMYDDVMKRTSEIFRKPSLKRWF